MDELQLFSGKIRDLIDRHGLRSVLDFGCGDGSLLKRIEADTADSVSLCGIDYFSRFAEDKRPVNRERITFVEKDSPAFGKLVSEQSYDLVVSTWALHHFELPVRELRSMHSLLRCGGFVFLVDFVFENGSDEERVKNLFSFVDEAYLAFKGSCHRHHYTREQALDLITAVPFGLVSHDIESPDPVEATTKEVGDHFKSHILQRISLIEKSDDPPLIKHYFAERYAEIAKLIDTCGFGHGPFFMILLRKVSP